MLNYTSYCMFVRFLTVWSSRSFVWTHFYENIFQHIAAIEYVYKYPKYQDMCPVSTYVHVRGYLQVEFTACLSLQLVPKVVGFVYHIRVKALLAGFPDASWLAMGAAPGMRQQELQSHTTLAISNKTNTLAVAVLRSVITEPLHWECNMITTRLFRLQQECKKKLKYSKQECIMIHLNEK